MTPLAPPMVYRVARRFITPPEDPPPYGLFALSALGHALCLFMAVAVSSYMASRLDQSKIYIVNLVPAAPPQGSPAPRAGVPVTRPPEPASIVKTPPRPEPEPAAPKSAKAEPTPPRDTPPRDTVPREASPRDVVPPRSRGPEPPAPPRVSELARAVPTRSSEVALPRRAEKETPALDTPGARERLVERTAVPVAPPAPPPRPPEPSRVVPPPSAPAPTPPRSVASPAPVAGVPGTQRPGLEPVRLGRPDSTVSATGSISLDVSDFPFTYYLRQIQAKISERWAPPRAAIAGGERAIVMFEIGRDGQIREPQVEKSSGNELYDQSARRAVLEASPFPPLPPEFKAPSLRVHFGFEFRADQG